MPGSPPRRECACAVAWSLHLRFPSPCRPAGAPGPAGPCLPAPAPVGFVSTGRRHPGCTLHATLGTSFRRLGAPGSLGLQEVWGPTLHSAHAPRVPPVGESEHRLHLSLERPVGDRVPPQALAPACEPQVRCSGAPGAAAGGWAVGVGLGALVCRPGPLPSAACARPKDEAVLVKRCWMPAPFPVTLLHLGDRGTYLALPPHANSNLCFRSSLLRFTRITFFPGLP